MEEIGHLGYLCFVYIKPSHLTDATLDVKYKRKKKKKRYKEVRTTSKRRGRTQEPPLQQKHINKTKQRAQTWDGCEVTPWLLAQHRYHCQCSGFCCHSSTVQHQEKRYCVQPIKHTQYFQSGPQLRSMDHHWTTVFSSRVGN